MKLSAMPANVNTPGAPPRRVGSYEVIGRLAVGGMAEIFLGRFVGPHGFERPVAMKRILPHLVEEPGFLDMFVAEARIAARIRHARVAQVHELAQCDGEYLLVMEYVEGESVGGLMRRMWLRGESLDRVLAAHIVAEACAGLHAAHELTDAQGASLGVVHRDVSPQNVMITYGGEVKVLDFGIAKAHDSGRTKTGHVKGKCEYMSPEQCRGESLDRQSDIFSLGVLLYELSVGKRLFKSENALLAFQAICNAPIPRPAEVDPAYPEVLEPICARALARDRRDRYATMLEMRRDLVAAIHRMTGAEGSVSDESLADLMDRLFTDRIHDKRDMLRQAPLNAALERIPVAEADAHVELPAVPRETRVELRVEALPPATSPSAALRRRAGLAVAAATAVVVGIGWALWFANRAPATVAAFAPAPAAEPEPTAGAPSPARQRGTVRLAVDSIPQGAEVSIGGKQVANTPWSIDLARTGEALTLVVSRGGFLPITERVVPDTDQKLVLHLQPVAAMTGQKKARSARPKSATPPNKAQVFERFD
jgi:eukaryotic-like serine/threonine-protein kinase